jgi:membrane protein
MANDAVGRLRKLQAEAQDALDDSRLAQRDEHEISALQRWLHFWVLVGRSFVRNRCPLRASGLAYASLLAMVPMLAVVISVSASLLKSQGEEPIQRLIDSMVERLTPQAGRMPAGTLGPPLPSAEVEAGGNLAAQPSTPGGKLLDPEEYERTRRDMARQINMFVGNIRSGALGATGMVALLFVAIAMLSRIEDTFNDIWGVPRGRSWFTRIVQYWGAMTLGPILLAVTFTLTSGSHFEATKRMIEGFGVAGAWLMKAAMVVLPYAIWSLAFALFYQLMPNTRVQWRAAAIGGVVGGCLWQLNSEFSVLYVSRVVTNSRIYGSLGMVPVFMIGLYFAWVIMLFGAQVAYAFQNRRTYLQEKQVEGVHQRSREFVALRLASEIARRFRQGEPAATLNELAEGLGIPTRLGGQVARSLVQARLLAEATERETIFLPARPLDQITVQDVLQAIRAGQGLDLATRADAARDVIRAEFTRIGLAEGQAAGSVTLSDLAGRLGSTGL